MTHTDALEILKKFLAGGAISVLPHSIVFFDPELDPKHVVQATRVVDEYSGMMTDRSKQMLEDLVDFVEKEPKEIIEEALHYLSCCHAGVDPHGGIT